MKFFKTIFLIIILIGMIISCFVISVVFLTRNKTVKKIDKIDYIKAFDVSVDYTKMAIEACEKQGGLVNYRKTMNGDEVSCNTK